MDAVSIREMVDDDVPEVLRIGDAGWRAAYGDILRAETIDEAIDTWYDPEMIREQIADEDAGNFVAERDGEVVGYVSGGPAEESGVTILGAIYVDPDYWGEGIGTALLQEFERDCRDRGDDTIRLHVLADNDIAVSFYRKHGYEAVDERETELFGETTREYIFEGAPADVEPS